MSVTSFIKPVVALAAILGLSAAVSACGKYGELERPAPLWGKEAKAQYEKEKAQEQQDKQADDKAPPRTLPTAKGPKTVTDPNLSNAPISKVPLDVGPNPSGASRLPG